MLRIRATYISEFINLMAPAYALRVDEHTVHDL